jgi:murein DD-endopeptidase MepM/ murein hydrolase activator NlpD
MTKIVPSPLNIVHLARPGEILFTPWPRAIKHLFINHRAFSLIQEKGFGVVDLNVDETTVVFGEFEIRKGHAFASPEQTLFIHEIQKINPKVATKTAKLRIPASTIKTIHDHDHESLEGEKLRVREILAKENGEFQPSCWQRPLTSKIVSEFASPRTLPDGRSYFHTGLDMRAWFNTPVRASASGTVVFADQMVLPGKMIIIDHGGGIFSRYLHLNEFKVRVGDKVKKNQWIALSGATGRVEAPHLHWEVMWKGTQVDPKEFLEIAKSFCKKGTKGTY